ncbi:MAG: 4Fe-4S cluster-binding domain-containing protein [Bacteroidales bacterium]|nr:4Fe-4S cluster-binding domain-containing protein [Bacteroidales bacterium]
MKYKAYTSRNFHDIPQISKLTEQQKRSIQIVSQVLPFKTNNYVVDELIDWDHFEDDSMFILNFPQKEMLSSRGFDRLSELMDNGASKQEIAKYVNDIRMQMNPHPAGQLEHNVPTLNGEKIQGIQHKYRETMLFFPSQGQTCHAYCTFCFRWPQFTGMGDIKFAMNQSDRLIEYLRQNPEITDILFTGGDPMIMKADLLRKYIDAILDADLPNIKTIRIGTKSLSFWPYRYLSDPDSTELLDLFRKISDRGIHLAIMAHFNHYKELATDAVAEATGKILSTNAAIRTQSPVLNHINASSDVWAKMWRRQVDMGMIPYYMFMARDTGAQDYFGVNMESALDIYTNAYIQVSGICRTVRGPSMSAGPGKVCINGIAEIKGEKVFVLSFIQGRLADWVGKPFFAKYDPEAYWLDDLVPAFGEKEFFYEKAYAKLLRISKLPGHTLSAEDLQSA